MGPERTPEPCGPNPDVERAKLDTEKAKLLWEEYKYRHDLIWRQIYKIIAASVILSVVPYARELVPQFGGSTWLLLIPPALAVVLALAAFPVMKNELHLFGQIKKEYREFQIHKLEFGINYRGDSLIECFVYLFLVLLLVLVVSNLMFAAKSLL